MTQSNFGLTGKLEIIITRADGTVTKDVVNNLVVQTGKNFVASALATGTSISLSHMAIGSGSTAPVSGDTTLQTETARVARSGASTTTNATTFGATFGAGTGTGTVAEAGLFNAASAGTMFARTLIGPYTKAAGDSITVNWTVTAG